MALTVQMSVINTVITKGDMPNFRPYWTGDARQHYPDNGTCTIRLDIAQSDGLRWRWRQGGGGLHVRGISPKPLTAQH